MWGDALPSVRRHLLAALLLVACLGPPATAQDVFSGAGEESQPFDVTADSVEFETDRNLYIARGNVRITQPDRTLTADWVAFSNETRQGIATGSVVVSEGGDQLFADVLHFEVDTLEGIVFEGRLEARGSEFRMTGDQILKTGEQTYVFDDGTFTTCRCPADETEPWLIRAEEANLEFGGYATTRNTTFDILGVPVLWLPWMRYPLKTERETGFLLPFFSSSSRSGGDFAIPFFWAARKNVNVLIEPHYLLDRGFKPELEIEYVFGRSSGGEFFASFIDDDEIDPNDISTPFDSERWALEWIHDHHLPRGWRFKTDARVVSDNLYAFDFRDLSRFRSDRYLEALGFLEKRFGVLGRYGFSAAVHYADDVQNPDDQDRDDFLLHRLPDLRLTGLPQPLAPVSRGLRAAFDLRYTHFYAFQRATRELGPASVVGDDVFLDTGIEAIPDGQERDAFGRIVRPDGTVELRDGSVLTAAEYLAAFPAAPPLAVDGSGDDFPPGPEGDGRFQEGEPLGDRGHRFVLNPRLVYPFRIADTLEVLPEVGWYGTFYQTDAQSAEFRNLFTFQLDVRSRLRRSVGLPFGLGTAVHLLEPRFGYTGVTSTSQRSNPLFVPRPRVLQQRLRQLDPWNIVRDPSDRIEAVNAITFGLGNRIYVPGDAEGLPPRLFADVSLSLQEDFSNSALRSFYTDATVLPTRNWWGRLILGFDLDETEMSETLLSTGWSSPTGHDLRLSYRFVRDIPRFFENFRFDEERFEEFEEGVVEVSQLDVFARWALSRRWALTYNFRYSFEQALLLANRGGVEYISRCLCWALRVELEDDRSRGFEFNLRYRIIGLGDDTVRPFQGRSRRRGSDPLLDDEGRL